MTDITVSDKLLKVYTNKNNAVFKSGAKLAYEHIINGTHGILYDDFNANAEIKKNWMKLYPEIKIYQVAKRGKTIRMDSKIAFHKKMKESEYTPTSYLSLSEVPEDEGIYFVKKDGSTSGLGVNAYHRKHLNAAQIENSVIQRSMDNPDLYDDKRYKIRQLVIVHNRKVYMHGRSFITYSESKFDNTQDNIREQNVINQSSGAKFLLSDELEDYKLIKENMINAVKDFSKSYETEINEITESEFVILGFDFVVDNEKNVHIIEINHRSNYAHPQNVSETCDVGCMRDLIILLVNQTIEKTKLVQCN